MTQYITSAAWIQSILEFLNRYSAHLACLFGGLLIGLIAYMIRHPEDFFIVETVEEDNPETVKR